MKKPTTLHLLSAATALGIASLFSGCETGDGFHAWPSDPFHGAAPMAWEVGTPARVDRCYPPKFPDQLRGEAAEYWTTVNVLIGENGRAQDVEIEESPHPLVAEAVRKAVMDWRYIAAQNGGEPVASVRTLRVLTFTDEARETTDDGVLKPMRFLVTPLLYPPLSEGPGEVEVEWVVNGRGIPENIEIIEATDPGFAYETEYAIEQWRYLPATYFGTTVPFRYIGDYQFER